MFINTSKLGFKLGVGCWKLGLLGLRLWHNGFANWIGWMGMGGDIDVGM